MDWNTAFTAGEGDAERGELTWGEREFRAVELGDKRRERRLKVVVEDGLVQRGRIPSCDIT